MNLGSSLAEDPPIGDGEHPMPAGRGGECGAEERAKTLLEDIRAHVSPALNVDWIRR